MSLCHTIANNEYKSRPWTSVVNTGDIIVSPIQLSIGLWNNYIAKPSFFNQSLGHVDPNDVLLVVGCKLMITRAVGLSDYQVVLAWSSLLQKLVWTWTYLSAS
jgi:hypothetical protein